MGIVVAFVAKAHGDVRNIFVGVKGALLPLPLQYLLGFDGDELMCL